MMFLSDSRYDRHPFTLALVLLHRQETVSILIKYHVFKQTVLIEILYTMEEKVCFVLCLEKYYSAHNQ